MEEKAFEKAFKEAAEVGGAIMEAYQEAKMKLLSWTSLTTLKN